MTTLLKTLLTPRVAVMTSLGCLLVLGMLFFMLKGCNGVVDMSNIIHPYISEKELKSTEPIEVDPFPEPSLEGLVGDLKAELGLTEAEIAETAEMIAQERFVDNLNYMDSRRDANSRQAEWDRRKRLVVAKPELLWTPGFIIPPTLDVMELKDNALYDYELKRDLKATKSGEERYNQLVVQWQNDEITDLEYQRGRAAIMLEENNPITIAKLLIDSGGRGSVTSQVGMEYAERARSENPDSFEAHHVWALCNRLYYLGTDDEKVIEGFRELVERFPNSSIANFDMAASFRVSSFLPTEPHSVAPNPFAEEALAYMQRAIQLDSRIEPNNEILAACYTALGEYEKALAVYQGMSEVYYGHGGGLVPFIYELQDVVSKMRQQQGE